jgi:hypothetical protein
MEVDRTMPPREHDGRRPNPAARGIALALAIVLATAASARAQAPSRPGSLPPWPPDVNLSGQPPEAVARKSAGCVACHQNTRDMHDKETVRLGCVDCHGGDASQADKARAHVAPQFPEAWRSSANPVRSYTLLNHESPEFIRFVNPGDLRIAHISCGTAGCHNEIVGQVRKSMMTTGAMLWGAALYNNGSFPKKHAHFGESYSMNGVPQRLQTIPPPTPEETRTKGVLPFLDPLPRYEVSQAGNILRNFERGGKLPQELGVPDLNEPPGRPLAKLSNRGIGTKNRTDPVLVSLNKTRLFDPTLNFLGTNDHPGDYRSSGCTACHVVYANDPNPVRSGPFAAFGGRGLSANPDPTIPKEERGHPIAHKFVWAPPTSQCIVCHTHPGTTVMNSYTGYMWWDNETDGEHMYPREEKKLTSEEWTRASMENPDEAAARGLWADPRFLERVSDLNPKLRHRQFAEFHSHGWVYSAVFKKDRKGNLLDAHGEIVPDPNTAKLMAGVLPPSPKERVEGKGDRAGIPLHLMDIHIEKGMHCADCHFLVSAHGNGKLYGEVRNAVEIECIDCHGTSTKPANLVTSGPASPPGGLKLATLRTPFGKKRFEVRGDKLIQNSMVEPGLSWEVTQTVDTITPGNRHYNEKSRLAKTVRAAPNGQLAWGDVPNGDENLCAHRDSNMSCISCHSSWNPSCYGCHLPQRANRKMPELHGNGDVARNYTAYDFQTLRDDVFMLARDGDVTGHRINPARSSCAIHVGSYNGIRESIYVQQQTISAEGPSGIAFSTNVPHTVRGGPPRGPDGRPLSAANYLPGRGETKQCTDCHLSRANDNNAIMAQLLMQGTNFMNFMGKWCYVAAGEEGLFAVQVTEQDEPQAVIGSHLHRIAYPERFREHVERGRKLETAHEHPGIDVWENLSPRHRHPEILSVQARGEYLYAACGENGLRVFDIATIDNKGFSERITTAPVSPFGQRFYVRTKFAAAVASPATTAPDPTRTHDPANKEPSIAAMYAYLYIADKYEGLVTVQVGTLLDGNPLNNFLERECTFNPNNVLCGARAITIVGTYAYISCDAGLVVVSIEDPKKPKVTSVIGAPVLRHPTDFQGQFRYGFVTDADGLKVFNIDDLAHPRHVATLPLPEARKVYVARTYAYVSGGKHGLIIVDVENPERPFVDQAYTAGGCINDLNDVKLGITNASEFAYLADGKNGLRVVQLTSPETPGTDGFSPRPTPMLVATYPIPKGGHALYVSEGVDRDRAVDESGNQLSVFGRIGAGPLSLDEQRRMYLRNGQPWFVTDDPRNYGPAIPPPARRKR